MKKALVSFLIIIFIFVGMLFAVYKALNDPRVTEKLLSQFAAPLLKEKGLILEECKIAGQRFSWPGEMVFNGISCRMALDKKQIKVTAEQLDVQHLERILKDTSEPVGLVLKGFSAKADQIQIKGARLEAKIFFKNRKLSGLNGTLNIASAAWQELIVTDIHSPVDMKDNTLYFDSLSAVFLDTALKGNFILVYAPQLSYSMGVDFKSLAVEKLVDEYPAVFTKVKGDFTGKVDVAGEASGVKTFYVKVTSPAGAQVQAQLLEPLLQYIPKSRQHLMLRKLIKQNDFVFFETTKLDIIAVDDETVQTAIEMKSKEFNLDLDLKVDFKMDGGISQGLSTFKQLLQ